MSRPGVWSRVMTNFWKYLRKDWSTKHYIGEDAAGHRYYEIHNTRQNVARVIALRQNTLIPTFFPILETVAKLDFRSGLQLTQRFTGYDPPPNNPTSQPSVEWQSWLKGARRFPPSEEEIKLNRVKEQINPVCFSGYDPPPNNPTSQPSVEWQSWLKGARRFPPSEEEIKLNRVKEQAQLAENEATERRAPHVATKEVPTQDRPASFPQYEDMESAPGAKKSG
ncbi:hypothetical protein NECAME_15656 [Necator americanus]|uniref:NADH dehydrogenase [ubiquinone] 1 alpha subcomplex subunit 12 n=1 Tax=Necator americanus TaxID=51031 RepID=W2SGK7_NECAM|nr:hypothetical protein NECAME_15656 [Necator americanus]ETN68730.1 hypothetical protein NECAME_15656 [Necator americanus]